MFVFDFVTVLYQSFVFDCFVKCLRNVIKTFFYSIGAKILTAERMKRMICVLLKIEGKTKRIGGHLSISLSTDHFVWSAFSLLRISICSSKNNTQCNGASPKFTKEVIL